MQGWALVNIGSRGFHGATGASRPGEGNWGQQTPSLQHLRELAGFEGVRDSEARQGQKRAPPVRALASS